MNAIIAKQNKSEVVYLYLTKNKMNINLVQICGRLTRTPENRTTQNGSIVASFSVASNRSWKDKQGQKVEETEFHNVVAFGRTAEVISQYFLKGDEIYIQGRLKTSSWDDKQSGQKRYKTDIIADRFEFGQKAKANINNQQNNQSQGQTKTETPVIDADTDEMINVDEIPL